MVWASLGPARFGVYGFSCFRKIGLIKAFTASFYMISPRGPGNLGSKGILPKPLTQETCLPSGLRPQPETLTLRVMEIPTLACVENELSNAWTQCLGNPRQPSAAGHKLFRTATGLVRSKRMLNRRRFTVSSVLLQTFKLQVNGKSEPQAQMSRAARSALCRVPTRLALVAHLPLLLWSTIGTPDHSPRVAVVQHSPDGASPHGVARGTPQSYGSFLDCSTIGHQGPPGLGLPQCPQGMPCPARLSWVSPVLFCFIF